MEILTTIKETRQQVKEWKKQGLSVALVPTMGYLHEGHKSLIDRARKELGFEPPISETANMEIDNTAGRVVRIPQSVKKATPAVFPTDNKYYRFMAWFWDRGAGDNLIRAQVAKIIKKEGLLNFHDLT